MSDPGVGPRIGGPADVPAITVAVDRFFQRVGTGCASIAPICANCGGEVAVFDGLWWHVRDLPAKESS